MQPHRTPCVRTLGLCPESATLQITGPHPCQLITYTCTHHLDYWLDYEPSWTPEPLTAHLVHTRERQQRCGTGLDYRPIGEILAHLFPYEGFDIDAWIDRLEYAEAKVRATPVSWLRGRDRDLLAQALEVARSAGPSGPDAAGEARVLQLCAEFEALIVQRIWKARERGWRSWEKAGRPT